MKKDLLSIKNLSAKDIANIFNLTEKLKSSPQKFTSVLKGKSVGLIFQKPSNRTRVSFEVGVFQMGGQCIYLGPDEIGIGKREAVKDVAKTLSRYLDIIVARTFLHQDVLDLAKYATIPVVNGLTDFSHPCQALADVYTIKERFKKLKNITLAYIGDGNNVVHSLLYVCAKTGVNLKIATPKGYEPSEAVVSEAGRIARLNSAYVFLTNTPSDGAKDADVVYTDVWASMGQEKEAQKRKKIFKNFQINSALLKFAKHNCAIMHCLPAHRGEEITDGVLDSKNSIVFQQAENRLHVQKAILTWLFKK